MFKVLFARHRALYFKLAIKYMVTPNHIYKLAHGGRSHSSKDSKICHELLELKVVHRHHFSSNPDDYKM